MRAHFEGMQEQERNAEKKKIKEEEQSGRKRRIQRKKRGFGENEEVT